MADIQRIVQIVLEVQNKSRGEIKKFEQNTEKAGQKLDKTSLSANKASASVTKFAQSTTKAAAATDKATKEVDELNEELEETEKQSKEAGASIRKLVAGLAGGIGLGAAVKAAADFSKQIAEVGTLVEDTAVSNDTLRDTVRGLSAEFGQDRQTVASALYQAISSGATAGAEANEFLAVALKLAIGGVTDARSAVDGLTTVINAFQLGFGEAERVADILFTTVKGGRTTVEELSSFLFQAAPIANVLGVSFEELSGAITAVTLQGTPARNAFTQIRGALLGLARDTPELNKVFQDVGFETGEAALKARGFAFAIQTINNATGGSIASIQKLVGTVEGAQAIASLGGENFGAFEEALRNVENASGAADSAFQEVAATLSQEVSETVVALSNAFESLGTALAPVASALLSVVKVIAEFITSVLENFPKLSSVVLIAATAFGTLRLAILALTFTQGAILKLAGGVAAVGTSAGTATKAVGLLNGVLRTTSTLLLRLAPFLIPIIAGYTAVAAAIDAVVESNDKAIASLKKTGDALQEIRALQQTLADSGIDADQLERELTLPLARALAASDPEITRIRLGEVKRALQLRVNQELELNKKLDAARNNLAATQKARGEQEEKDRVATNETILKAAIDNDKKLLKSAKDRLREAVAAEKEAAKQIADTKASSEEFQKGIQEEIDDASPLRGGEDSEEVKQAKLALKLGGELRDARAAIANATTAEEAEKARAQVVEAAATARLLGNDSLRFLKLTEISQLEKAAAAATIARATEEEAAAKKAQVEEKVRIDELAKGIKQIKDDIKALSEPIEPKIDIDTEAAQMAINTIKEQLQELANTPVVIPIAPRIIPPGESAPAGDIPAAPFAEGGPVGGTGNSDNQLALLTPGEFVINKASTSRFRGLLESINSRSITSRGMGIPKFQDGGVVAGPTERLGRPVNITLPSGASVAMAEGQDSAESIVSTFERESRKRGRRVRS